MHAILNGNQEPAPTNRAYTRSHAPSTYNKKHMSTPTCVDAEVLWARALAQDDALDRDDYFTQDGHCISIEDIKKLLDPKRLRQAKKTSLPGADMSEKRRK
eukprot:8095603-Karenia_brevis.AAC.1